MLPQLFDALEFAAVQHQYQRRSGYSRLPYINHLIKVA
ncbi:MAG: phosphohydrolase, partial [Bacteroidetes bacterium]